MFTELQENFVGFESFFELNSWHSSYVRQTWMAQLILAKFLCGELSSFYPRGFCYSYAYMHIWFYRFCKRVTCFCTRLIFRKHLELLFMFSTGFIQFLLFYLPVTFFVDSFDAISINMQEILSVNPSANVVLSLETLMSIISTEWPILVELIGPVNPVIIFSSQMNLLRELKLMSAIFHQISIFSSNDRSSKTMKKVFYFIEKALFVVEIFKLL